MPTGYELLAAVDLGSNSFRLQIGRVVDDQIYPLDSLKEPVRLASGLQADKTLDAASQERALQALARFGERLRSFEAAAVRAVATNTLRVARTSEQFMREAESALGFPLEIIAGREEARLIYIGAAHSLPWANHRRLVVDIGGGSTEFIIGTHFEPELMESLYMGCVSYSLKYFPGGKVTKKAFQEAEMAARREVQLIAHDYVGLGWSEAVGSSGTARAIADILEANRLNPQGVPGITREGLWTLRNALIKAGQAESLRWEAVRTDRLPVLPGGIAILCAIFDALGIDCMTYADGALRLGVLYDLLGRFHHHDMRDATVRQFMRRYQVDMAQAGRVQDTALKILDQISPGHEEQYENDVCFLRWAASMHEIGISIAHTGYHKHGAYILAQADMPGFSKRDQERLSQLVLSHRGKLERVMAIPGMTPENHEWLLIFSLRLAAVLHRAREGIRIPDFRIEKTTQGFDLQLGKSVLRANPMTMTTLREEVNLWNRVGFELTLSDC